MVAPSLDKANDIAKRLAAIPEVSRTLTVSNFIPGDQDKKSRRSRPRHASLGQALNPPRRQPEPSDADIVAAIRATASDLSEVAGDAIGPGADAARQVSGLLERLAQSNAAREAGLRQQSCLR